MSGLGCPLACRSGVASGWAGEADGAAATVRGRARVPLLGVPRVQGARVQLGLLVGERLGHVELEQRLVELELGFLNDDQASALGEAAALGAGADPCATRKAEVLRRNTMLKELRLRFVTNPRKPGGGHDVAAHVACLEDPELLRCPYLENPHLSRLPVHARLGLLEPQLSSEDLGSLPPPG